MQTTTTFDPAGNRAAYAVSGATSSPNVVGLSISNATVSEGGLLTFTVTKSGTATAPVSVGFATANGSAVAGNDYNAASGTLTFAPSDTTKTITVSTIDDTINEPTESFSVVLSAATGGATINGATGTGTINDNDPAPSFTIGNAGPVTEGGSLTFTITKTGATSVPVDVYSATANGSAIAGSDYNAASGALTFAPSDTTKTITISTIDDAVNEPTETFTVSLSATSGGATISAGTGTINDNDAAPSFAINNAAAVSEGAALTFTVTKSGTTSQGYAVNFATANGSAVAGSDYNTGSGTLSFAPGDTSKTITVSTIDDGINEPTESFTVSLSAPSGGATIGTASGAGTINDNDPPPSFSIGNAGPVTEGGAATFTVTKSGTTVQTYAVNFATADGGAVAGSDYNAVSGMLTFAPGDTAKTITISAVDDAVNEPTETFSVSLSGSSGGATIGNATGTATINDNDAAPSFSIGNAGPVTEGSALVFMVTKSGGTSQTYAVNFATANDSAAAGSDYNATSGTLTFAPGDTAKTITVSTIDDSAYEPRETLTASLSSPTGGATVGTITGTGTIDDNDVAPPMPITRPDTISFNCSLTRSLNVVTNDYDPGGYTPLSLVSATSSDPGQMWVNIVNSTTISLAASNSGTYYVTYVIRNTAGGTAAGNVTATVTGSVCQTGP
ncbi:MAG: Calx-beta domain-containing protein [Sphingomonas sp.]